MKIVEGTESIGSGLEEFESASFEAYRSEMAEIFRKNVACGDAWEEAGGEVCAGWPSPRRIGWARLARVTIRIDRDRGARAIG